MGTTLTALLVRQRAFFGKKCDRLERKIEEALSAAGNTGKELVLRNNFDVFEKAVVSEVSLRFPNLDIARSPDGQELTIRRIA